MSDPIPPEPAPPGPPLLKRLSTLRLFTFIVVFLGLAGYAVWKSDRFQNLVQGVSQSRLSEALGVPVDFDTVEISMFPPALRVENVRVGNDPRLALPPDAPLLTAEQISVGGGASLAGGQLRLGRIRALRPRIFLQQLPDGRFNLPPGLAGPTKKPGGVQVRIGSLLVQEGVLDFRGRKIGIDGELEDFAAELLSRGPDRYSGVLVARRGTFRLPRKEPILAAVSLRFLLDSESGVTVDDLRLEGPFGRLGASGSLENLSDPRVGLLVTADLSIEEVERIFHSPLGFEGQAQVRARVQLPSEGGFRITGTLRAPRARRPPFLLQDVAATIVARPQELVARIARARYAGGEAQGTFRISELVGRQLPMTLAVDATGLSLESFFADIGLPGTGLSGQAALQIALRWAEEGIDESNGGGLLTIRPGPASSIVRGRFGVPTEGGSPLAVVRGRIGFEKGTLRFPSSTVDFTGGIPIGNWQPDFDFRLRSRDFSEIDRIFQNFVAASGKKPERLGLGGSGEVEGHLSRSWANPVATAQLTAEDAAYGGVVFGSARGSVDMADGAFFFRPLRVYDGDATLSLEGRAAYQVRPGRAPFDLAVSAKHFPLSRLLRYLDLDLPVEGKVTGSFPVAGSKEALTGGGAVELAEAVVWGQPFEQIAGRAILTPGKFTLEEVRAGLGGGMIGGGGSWELREKEFEARLAGDGVSIDAIGALKDFAPDLDGTLSFQLSGRGTLEQPDLTVTASLAEARFYEHEVPEGQEPRLEARVDDGHLEGEVSAPGFRISASGDVFRGGAPLEVELEAEQLASLLRFTPIDLPAGYGGSLAMTGTLVLPSRPDDVLPTGTIRVARAVLDFPEKPGALKLSDPATLTLDGRQLRAEPFQIAGEGTQLDVKGSVRLAEPRSLDVGVSGPFDPALVSAVFPDLGLTGKFHASVAAAGPLSSPNLSGELRLEAGKYRIAALSQIVDDINGAIRFSRAGAGDVQVRARIGGGEVSVGGSFDLEGLEPRDYRLTVQGRRITVRYPQDVRLLVDADLVATGGASGNLVRGEVVLLQGTYTRDFDLTLTDLLSRSRPTGVAAARDPFKEKTRLEVHVVSSQSLEVRNNLARLTGTVDLLARGTLADPTLVGQVNLDEGGRVTLFDVRYDIESGSVTFVGSRGLAPILDLRARAEVKGYELAVNLSGTWPRLETSFSSDPPLTDEAIANLLLTGTRPGPGNTPELSATLASTAGGIVGSAATSVFTRPAQKLFKLERFQIEPIFTSSGLAGATTTVGKQISPNWSVVYSQPLFEAGSREPVVEVEGRISQTWILRLRHDENGVYLIDLRRRTRP
ncbi:MAG TPA: translocation/assembly module TamB domain-containing protein [Thermoanaerobaculia bacterium]